MARVMAADAQMECAALAQSPYAQWVRSEGLDVLQASAPFDLRTVDLKPWARRGGRGAYIQAAAVPLAADCYVCEIPPGQRLAPQRHLFEEIVLVIEGRGSTTLSVAGGEAQSFEWRAGTVFAVPRNATYRHFNGSGKNNARLVGVTTAPTIINTFADLDFVFGCGHVFSADRVMTRGAAHMAAVDGACGLDALDSPLMESLECGAGGHLRSSMGTRSLSIWIAQLPPATYGKAHAFGSDAYAFVLAGEGCTLASPGSGERTCRRWQRGSVVAVPRAWWRQHFNAGRAPARFVTFSAQAASRSVIAGTMQSRFSEALGAECIDYADEGPAVRATFAAALAERGLESRMAEAYALEAKGR